MTKVEQSLEDVYHIVSSIVGLNDYTKEFSEQTIIELRAVKRIVRDILSRDQTEIVEVRR